MGGVPVFLSIDAGMGAGLNQLSYAGKCHRSPFLGDNEPRNGGRERKWGLVLQRHRLQYCEEHTPSRHLGSYSGLKRSGPCGSPPFVLHGEKWSLYMISTGVARTRIRNDALSSPSWRTALVFIEALSCGKQRVDPSGAVLVWVEIQGKRWSCLLGIAPSSDSLFSTPRDHANSIP